MNPLFLRSRRVLGSLALVTALVATSAVPAHAAVSSVPSTTVSTASSAASAALKSAIPKVLGSARVGATLTARPGSWTSGTSFSYQWLRNGTSIPQATRSAYALTAADLGRQISLKVTGKKSGYSTVSKTSGKTGKVKVGTLKGATPRVTGTTKVGSTLKVSRGIWSTGVAFSYQWLRNGKAIAKATGTGYKLVAADTSKKISVKVTAKRVGYSTLARTSAPVGPIKAKTTSNRAAPKGKNCPSSHPIKGNASSGIYHVPSGAYYSRTVPEECFKTEAAAKAAGYRKSKR